MKSMLSIADIRKNACTLEVSDTSLAWYQLDAVSSTMDAVKKLAENGEAPWALVTADTQTEGRGTNGRSWYSPVNKGLWVSFLLPLPKRIDLAADVTLIAASNLQTVLLELYTINCTIKHPNDLLVNGNKIAGIMVESITDGTKPRYLILGMGLNLTGSKSDFFGQGLESATSIEIESGSIAAPDTILKAFLAQFITAYTAAIHT